MSFAPLGLATPLLKAVADQGYETPSPIQAQAIPAVLQGRDVMAAAQTGTGKTAGFTLPLLHRLSEGQRAGSNRARALILTPTRELAAQIGENVTAYSKYLSMRSAVVFGGVSINPQMKALRQGVDVLVATPGRLLDLYNQNAVRFSDLEVLVLDEADRMLDMGFINDIKKILKVLPAKRQNLLFSATFSDDIRKLAKGLVNDPVEIDVSPRNSTVKTVTQTVYTVDKKRKPALLTQLIQDGNWRQALVFTKTKHGANRLSEHLEKNGIRSAAIHGNKSQGARTKALSGFKAGKINILVATDIAARGLDIDQLPQVVNFDLPNVPEDYVHRIGRTGRAGAKGQAYSLVSADEAKLLAAIERLTKQTITRTTLDGFEPDQNVPHARPDDKPRARRPGNGSGGRGNANGGGRGNGGGNRSQGNRSQRSNGNGQSQGRDGQSRDGQPARRRPRSGNRSGNRTPNGNRA
ncbi:ATP-dependent RNA helicase [Saccharospirillum sp. MSK14-1]|uniref:DEAD/DEAH box helicase n=1 Tax=Saccharospirillum sp. MSK14-1 TaxID=1897632 RepID=UPI000D34CBC4|nr:DEAD/DEAH box helicase [Saccharospirillum sp. MSK14-1]PTY37870.1 ATP-dependent RNA helicase [Saccharospirillum sp. MSK14-1]